MVSKKTTVLAAVFVIGIAATGVTLAAGVTNTGGVGVADVDSEPLNIEYVEDDPDFVFTSDNGEEIDVNQFTTAEGADVVDVEVSNIDGGNEFTITTLVSNTADDSLFLTTEVETVTNSPDGLTFLGVNEFNPFDEMPVDLQSAEVPLPGEDIGLASGPVAVSSDETEVSVAELGPLGDGAIPLNEEVTTQQTFSQDLMMAYDEALLEGANPAILEFEFRTDNDANANDVHEFIIDFQFEERSPGQT